MYNSHLKMWVDGVSGNKSKQYNEHSNVYVEHANIPNKLLQQEYFVLFLSTSPHAMSWEQFNAMVDDIWCVPFLI